MDNIDVDPGTSGAKQPVATDDCGVAGHFQRIKLDIGGDGVSSPVTAANGLPVTGTVTTGPNASVTAATFSQGVKTVADAATPEVLVGSTTLVESVVIQAKNGFDSSNTDSVFIGFSGTDDSNYLELTPGDSLSIDAPQGKKLDLNLIFIECLTAGDGVTYTAVN